MKKVANVIRIEEPEEDAPEWLALLDLIKKQAELDEKLQSLVVAVATAGE